MSSSKQAGIHEILLLHHTHTDIGFTHSQPVVWELHDRFIDRALDLCEETADWPEPSRTRWTCEVTATLLHWLDSAPEQQIRRLRQLAADGLIGAGAMFCNITPLYNAEQLVRSLYPVKRLRDALGLRLDTAINHDVNGLPWPLVGLLRDIGVHTLLMGINPHFGGFPLHRPLLFNWVGPDDHTIRVFNGEHYASFERWLEPQSGSTNHMAEGLQRYLTHLFRQSYPHDFIALSATHSDFADNNPPNPHTSRMVRRWNDEGRQPLIRFVTADQLAARLRREDMRNLPTHRGDWPDFWNFGCASSATETRINRHTKTRLNAAGLLDVISGPPSPAHSARSNKAWHDAMIYDEHTWGSWASTWNCQVDEVPAQFNFKANHAYQARCWTGWLIREHLERLTRNPVEGGNPAGILLVNPGPENRSVMLTVPTRLVTGAWVHHPGRVHNLEVPAAWLTDDEEREIGPYQVDACATRYGPASELCAMPLPFDRCRATAGTIESPYYRLEFDPASGHVTGLVDKSLGADLLDSVSPWDFAGYVRESVDPQRHRGNAKYHGRDALFDTDFEKLSVAMQSGWKHDWPALRQKPGMPDTIDCQLTGPGPQLVLRWTNVPGARDLQVTVTLAADRPVVLMDMSFHKDSDIWAESTYLTFPLKLRNWRAWYDVAGQVAELDAEQLPGCVRDYATVGTWVAAADENICIMLACPDAPMVQIGGFQFGQCLTRIPREQPCLLLGWPLNNYWDTNFPASQPGFKRFRYELTSARAFDPAVAMSFGLAAATPVEYHPVLSRPAITEGRLIETNNPNVSLTSLRRTMDGTAVLLHLTNPTATPQSIRLNPKLPFHQAFISNPLEEPLTPVGGDAAIELSVAPRSHLLVRLEE